MLSPCVHSLAASPRVFLRGQVPKPKDLGLLKNKPIGLPISFSFHRGWQPNALHDGRKPPSKVCLMQRYGLGLKTRHKTDNQRFVSQERVSFAISHHKRSKFARYSWGQLGGNGNRLFRLCSRTTQRMSPKTHRQCFC